MHLIVFKNTMCFVLIVIKVSRLKKNAKTCVFDRNYLNFYFTVHSWVGTYDQFAVVPPVEQAPLSDSLNKIVEVLVLVLGFTSGTVVHGASQLLIHFLLQAIGTVGVGFLTITERAIVRATFTIIKVVADTRGLAFCFETQRTRPPCRILALVRFDKA
jgi:hypothetical protein